MDNIVRGIFCIMMSAIAGILFYFDGGMFEVFTCGLFFAFAISAFADEISLRMDVEDEEDIEDEEDEEDNNVKENT